MAGSYELQLFRPAAGAALPEQPLDAIERGEGMELVDSLAIGSFLLSLGSAISFGGSTALGELYIYEDEQNGAFEIMVSERSVVLGFSNLPDRQVDSLKRVVNAVALSLVARFGLVLYDPQRRRYVRAARTTGHS